MSYLKNRSSFIPAVGGYAQYGDRPDGSSMQYAQASSVYSAPSVGESNQMVLERYGLVKPTQPARAPGRPATRYAFRQAGAAEATEYVPYVVGGVVGILAGVLGGYAIAKSTKKG